MTESAALVVGGVSDPETFLAPGRIAVRDRSCTPGRIGGPSQERDRGTPPKVSRTRRNTANRKGIELRLVCRVQCDRLDIPALQLPQSFAETGWAGPVAFRVHRGPRI